MEKSKKIKFICIAVVLIILIILLFCYFYMVKNLKNGNNKTSQEMVENILNMKSYEATVEVEVKSNKNQNKYIIKQKYNGKNDNYQEVLEPSNIKGVKITKTNDELKLENTNLNLVYIFENYQYLSENQLDLDNFVNQYKENDNSKYIETQNEIIMEVNTKVKKSLYIDRKTGMPTKLEIKDTNKKTAVYILYKEIVVNS